MPDACGLRPCAQTHLKKALCNTHLLGGPEDKYSWPDTWHNHAWYYLFSRRIVTISLDTQFPINQIRLYLVSVTWIFFFYQPFCVPRVFFFWPASQQLLLLLLLLILMLRLFAPLLSFACKLKFPCTWWRYIKKNPCTAKTCWVYNDLRMLAYQLILLHYIFSAFFIFVSVTIFLDFPVTSSNTFFFLYNDKYDCNSNIMECYRDINSLW